MIDAASIGLERLAMITMFDCEPEPSRRPLGVLQARPLGTHHSGAALHRSTIALSIKRLIQLFDEKARESSLLFQRKRPGLSFYVVEVCTHVLDYNRDQSED